MAAEYNLIRFNSHKDIVIKKIWEKKRKDQTRTQDVTEFGFKNVNVSETLNLQQLRLSRNTKNSFTLVDFGSLYKNGLLSLSVTRVTTHSKIWVTTHSKQEVSHNTLKKVSTTAQKGLSTTAQENVYKKITNDQVGRIERS
jgi:hypothetical protein